MFQRSCRKLSPHDDYSLSNPRTSLAVVLVNTDKEDKISKTLAKTIIRRISNGTLAAITPPIKREGERRGSSSNSGGGGGGGGGGENKIFEKGFFRSSSPPSPHIRMVNGGITLFRRNDDYDRRRMQEEEDEENGIFSHAKKNNHPHCKNSSSPISEEEAFAISHAARNVFMSQANLLDLEAPITICGDIHGQFEDLLKIFHRDGFPPWNNYLFLGDYVDRGKESLETICLLFSLKIAYPEHIFLLRGNHEDASISRIYGFYDECKRKHSVKLWRSFIDTFNCMPIAAVVADKIFCIHGGISPSLQSLDQILTLKRPFTIPTSGVVCDLLWSDPLEGLSGWGENERGVSYTFGEDAVQSFNQHFSFDLVCRAHQVMDLGYKFFAGRNLVTVFSAPKYCGAFDNKAAVMKVADDLLCSFVVYQ